MTNRVFASKSVLVVDDHEFLRSIIVDILGNIGISKIYTAHDGAQAITEIKTRKPDVVITDWVMEPVDGLALTRWIRRAEDSPNSNLPVIMLTGNGAKEQVIQARDAGVSEIIIKPVVPVAVISRLHSVLKTRRKFVQSANYVGPDRRRRRSADYNGARRRLTDIERKKPAVKSFSEKEQRIAGKIMVDVNAMNHSLESLDVTRRAEVLTLYRKVEALWEFTREEAPKLVEIATESLLRYIQAFGADGHLKSATMKAHLDAIMRLVSVHALREKERKSLVDALLKDVSVQISSKKRA